MDTKALVEQSQNGDLSAYTGIVERFQGPLFGYLGRMGLYQGQAEEIAQEAFLRAWTRLRDYDPARSQFSTWLFTIARNLALNELGHAASRHEVKNGEALPETASDALDPAQALIEAQRRRRLHAALRTLPVAERSALALSYFGELDMAAIARIEGCTSGAVKVRIHRAKQRLRELLESPDG